MLDAPTVCFPHENPYQFRPELFCHDDKARDFMIPTISSCLGFTLGATLTKLGPVSRVYREGQEIEPADTRVTVFLAEAYYPHSRW